MKLTVCFGQVKVIVPCGDGDLTVRDLIGKATSRYTASLQENIEIDVNHLQTEDDAILYDDDVINDVCDDKDKLIAIFQEKTSSIPPSFNYQALTQSKAVVPTHVTSSTGNGLPSVTGYSMDQIDRIQPVAPPPEFDNEKPPIYPYNRDGDVAVKPEKRSGREWRREAPRKLNEKSQHSSSQYSSSASSTPVSSPDTTKDSVGFNRFDRNLARKSLSTAHPLLYSWIDAQERRNEDISFTHNIEYGKENRFSESRSSLSGPSIGDYDDADEISSTSSEEIELETRLKEDFGLRVQGYRNADGKELGLIVHEIKNDSVVGKRGSLNVADRITEVNGINLRGMTNSQAETVLNEALADGAVKLKRTRSHHFIRASLRNVSMDKHVSLPKVPEAAILSSREAPRVKQPIGDAEIHEAPIEDPKSEALAAKPNQGNRILIELSKGATGLGFSITSRDVVTGGHNPVYVKNILAKGAAIADGRLKVGDQILEINNTDVSCKGQSEIVRLLKSASGIVRLLVSRQSIELTDNDDNEEAMETTSNDSGISTVKDELLTITIPLNDLGSAGLGISVKGKSTEDNLDLGIFVKSIIKGGAAAKDGRLKPEDRLLQINTISLDGFSNDKAMETLRTALKESVEHEMKIKIVVSRKSKSEHGHTVPDGKPELQQAPVRPSVLALERKGHALTYSEFQMPPSPNRDKPYTEVPKLPKRKSDSQIEVNRKPPSARDNIKFVSVSSGEIPLTQPCRPVVIDRSSNVDSRRRQLVEIKSTIFPKQKEFFYQSNQSKEPDAPATDENYNLSIKMQNPPSYNETLKRLSISSSETSSTKSSLKNFSSRDLAIEPADEVPSMAGTQRYLIDDTLDNADLIRTMSTSSRFSIDSLMLSPEAMPFSRDAFGRLSMSERKGRAHLDATKSTLYTKLKKSKSLENVHSVNSFNNALPMGLLGRRSSTDDNSTDIVPLREAARRTESLDTLLNTTHIPTADEEEAFHRNTALSKSTPWYAQRTVSPTALKLRSRSNAWNDSFRSAIDRSSVFYTHNGGTTLKAHDVAIPIQLTSNANYDAIQQSKKKAGIFKGIGNLLKKNKPRKMESKSKEKEIVRNGKEATDYEMLIDFPRRPRPHSVHEEFVGNAFGNASVAVRERERAKREREDRLVSLQRELNHVEASENAIRSSLMQRQLDGNFSKHSVNDEVWKPSRHEVEDGASQQPVAHKSLLQRGQERILQRDKNQQNVKQQMDMKPAIRKGNVAAKSKRNLADEFNEPEKEVSVKDENPMQNMTKLQPGELKARHVNLSRSKPVQNQERLSDRKADVTSTQLDSTFDPWREQMAGSEGKKTFDYIREPNNTKPALTGDSRIAMEEQTGPNRQRHLPEVPLFYYGHSSLPRKFITSNGRTHKTTMQRGYAAPEKSDVGKCGKPSVQGGERKISGHIYREKNGLNKVTHQNIHLGDAKQSGYSIEEQTEAFIRAQQGHELRTSKRASAQHRSQEPNIAIASDRTVTISHAANI